MIYAGKGFALDNGGAINAGVDWTQSFGDTRKRYLGYDRITATIGYSNNIDVAGRPIAPAHQRHLLLERQQQQDRPADADHQQHL